MLFRSRFLYLVAVIAFWLAAFAARSAVFSTIVTNGPTTNRVNLVFFSEGYTNGQMGKFLTDATNATVAFFSTQPYTEYSNYFNVFAIFTNSAHAGSTHLAFQSYVNGYTYFNSAYDAASDYLITIPPNASDANGSHGQGKINALLWTNYAAVFRNTNNNLAALLVNDPVRGGSDNYGNTAISSVPNVSYILVHESGHVLGGLGDEYSTAYPGYTNRLDTQPNTTTNTAYTKIKWNAWIATNTPLPTPPTAEYQYTVGLLTGARYQTTNWYRPYYDCCMKSFGYSVFCPVCQEALVLAIASRAHLMDGRLPATNSLAVTNSQAIAFSLQLQQPATHSLSVQWLTNRVPVGGATNATLDLWPLQLGNGTNKVEADVWDATALVRKDTKAVLRQTNIWTLNISVPVMQIDTLRWATNGNLTFRITGSAPAGVVIQASTNLQQWTAIKTGLLSGGMFFYTNSGSKTAPRQFFRTKTPP